jgi:hypothetical protein
MVKSRLRPMCGLPPQQAGAQRVEGGDPHRAAIDVEQRLHPLAHLCRGLVGERDGDNLVRLRHAL